MDWSFQNNRYCGEKKPGYRAYCHPDNYDGIANVLYHNNGDGTFTDVSSKAGIADANGKGLGVSFADYDHDGFMDVYVANDSVQSFLYRNNGNGTFAEVGLLAGVGFNEDGKTFAGMGVDFADYDNDGRPDIFVTDLSNERYRLFRQNGDGSFRDVTNMSGVGGATLPFSGWSTRFFDYDNDGWKDIFVAQGHVMDTIEKTAPNLRYLQPPLLLRNESGRFVRVVPGEVFRTDWAGRGAAFGDLDNDGDVDVVVEQRRARRPLVLRNDGGNRQELARDPNGRQDIEPRRDRLPGEGRVRIRTDAALHRQHGRRLSVGQRQAAARRSRRRCHGHARRDPLAVRSRPDIRERQGRTDAGGDRASRLATELASRTDDHPPRDARAAGVLGRSGVRTGHLLAQRQAAAPRQAVRPSVSGALHRRRRSRRA